MNKKITKLIFITILFCGFNFTVLSQPIEIIFTSGTTLTQDRVNTILEANRDAIIDAGGFIAIIADNVTTVGSKAFERTGSNGTGNSLNNLLIEVRGKNVKTIESRAFWDCSRLVSVEFSLATTISDRAFSGCQRLISVDLPLVTAIGNRAFSGCQSLINADFSLVTAIREYTFSGCRSLTSVSFPLVTTIGPSAFFNCQSLTSIDFPLVTTINQNAFSNCSNLRSVNLPSIASIGGEVFRGCSKLENISLGTDLTIPTTIYINVSTLNGTFSEINTLNRDTNTLNIDLILGENVLPASLGNIWNTHIWKSVNGNTTTPSIPIPTIIFKASQGTTLTRHDVNATINPQANEIVAAGGYIAVIDDDVTGIGARAFRGSGDGFESNSLNLFLLEVSGKNVSTISNFIFISCINLVKVDFPVATTVGLDAFRGCSSLVSVNFPFVKTIESNAFSNCINLNSVSFGTGFETEIEIEFGWGVFGITNHIDLILGANVLPAPDLFERKWQSNNHHSYPEDYVWKSITIQEVGIKETIKNHTVNIYPNPTVSTFTVSFELEKSCNMKIILSDIQGVEIMRIYDGFATVGNFERTVKTENLTSGIYFLKIFVDGKYTVEKVIVE